jgi:carbon monoxide dehydrogenase subunit G
MDRVAVPHRFALADLRATRGTLLHLATDDHGMPVAATAATLVDAPPSRVWPVVSDVSSFGARIPMIHHIQRDGDRVTLKLRFKVALFSFGFEVLADAHYEEGKWLELRYVEGEPRDMRLRLEVEGAGDGATVVHADIGFDIFSLGWLVKTFLRHHPEIRLGIFPGSAITILDAMRRAVAEGGGPL